MTILSGDAAVSKPQRPVECISLESGPSVACEAGSDLLSDPAKVPTRESVGPDFELIPQPARGLPFRITGPGRRERAYLTRVASLSEALETAELLERGASRRLDRVEHELTSEVARHRETSAQSKRLLVTLGALQRENELLRARVESLEAPRRAALEGSPQRSEAGRPEGRSRGRSTARSGARRPGFWGRLFRSS